MDKKRQDTIPECTAKRLPRYLRALKSLMDSGIYRASSASLASKLGSSPSQVRQDLSSLGEFGLRGYGYDVRTLYTAILDLSGTKEEYSAVIFGTSEMISLLRSRPVFVGQGVALKGCVESASPDAERDFLALCAEARPDIAVLASDEKSAENVCRALASTGIRGIWNLSGARLKTNIPVRNLWLDDSLMTLCYKLGKDDRNKEKR